MFFHDGGRELSSLPAWASYLIKIGFRWPSGTFRRVLLVSMPCDSAAAGLITLGSLIRDLGNPKANNIEGHYAGLLRYATQYIRYCRVCRIRCVPDVAGCGYAAEASGLIRHRASGSNSRKGRKKLFTISERTIEENRLILSRPDEGNLTWWPDLNGICDLQIDGEPFPENRFTEGQLSADPYRHLVDDASFISENLQRSYSGLCLAGRSTGEDATKHICAGIRFDILGRQIGLDELLTIQGWSRSASISRVAFFNSRTEKFDRNVLSPALVVADGDMAFRAVIANREFQRSDVIGVIHRTLQRERLEAVGNQIQSMRQWYTDDIELVTHLAEPPRGISIAALRKSQS